MIQRRDGEGKIIDRDALARKIKDAIFDRAEADGRVMHGDSVVDVIKGVLAMEVVEHREGAAKDANPWFYVAEYPQIGRNGYLTIGHGSCAIAGNPTATGNSITMSHAAGIAPVSAIPQDG